MQSHVRTSHALVFAAITSVTVAGITHLAYTTGEQKIAMPDPMLTPGATFGVTSEELCVAGYSAKVRNVPASLKRQVFERYKITSHKPGEYEVDHLISLELGGSNDISNLWPQPYNGPWNAHMKDRLENKLHQLVCDGVITLEEAQTAISQDWVEAYQKYISN